MYLLYADESGDLSDPSSDVLVIGGIAVHEDAVRPLAGAINERMNRFVGKDFAKRTELHAAQMRTGSREWNGISERKRHGLGSSLMRLVHKWEHDPTQTKVQPFVIVMDRGHSQSPLETAYGELLYLFDEFLRDGRKRGLPHNGVLVADRSKYEKTLHAWVETARERRPAARRPRPRLHALVETPFFVDSKTTRLMQLADLVAHSFYRAYNAEDWAWAKILVAGVLDPTRLVHFTSDRNCTCPACSLAVKATA
jgi:uncharacterized protein DUF3800